MLKTLIMKYYLKVIDVIDACEPQCKGLGPNRITVMRK